MSHPSENRPIYVTEQGILLEAEAFDDFGGWILETQFVSEMGSPYLLAHGLGTPVADAKTEISVPAGEYEMWVRSKDWVPGHHPGQFQLEIGGKLLETVFGANDKDWSWEFAGRLVLAEGAVSVALRDLTGFAGRCDAIYFGRNGEEPPNEVCEESRQWRRALRGLPEEPVDSGDYDLVVVGGGVSGCAAALTAARLGQRVALIQDRPILGGNASREIGIMPRGTQGALLKELSARTEEGDLLAFSLLEAEPLASVFTEHRVFAIRQEGAKIVSVDAVAARTGEERRFRAKTFIDASGVATFGVLGQAETMFGREAQAEYGEQYAPNVSDEMHHGNTLFFRTGMAPGPVSFPEVPWATEVAKDYADLGGQLIEPGRDNGPGPFVGNHPKTPDFRFGEHEIAASHFWEYGQWLDPYKTGELVRDYLMRALYGTFSNVKAMEPEKYANLEFEWMAHVTAKGEYARYRGDYVVSERDISEHTSFEDSIIANDGALCIHCAPDPGEAKYDFRAKDWIYDWRDRQPYAIPFRSLYSVNVDNLMMAGKHISVTHIAGSATKFMGNGAQHGVAVAAAAFLCNKLGVLPRELYENHLADLKAQVAELTGCDHDMEASPPRRHYEPTL